MSIAFDVRSSQIVNKYAMGPLVLASTLTPHPPDGLPNFSFNSLYQLRSKATRACSALIFVERRECRVLQEPGFEVRFAEDHFTAK